MDSLKRVPITNLNQSNSEQLHTVIFTYHLSCPLSIHNDESWSSIDSYSIKTTIKVLSRQSFTLILLIPFQSKYVIFSANVLAVIELKSKLLFVLWSNFTFMLCLVTVLKGTRNPDQLSTSGLSRNLAFNSRLEWRQWLQMTGCGHTGRREQDTSIANIDKFKDVYRGREQRRIPAFIHDGDAQKKPWKRIFSMQFVALEFTMQAETNY